MAWWDELKTILANAAPPTDAPPAWRGPYQTAWEYPTTDPNVLAFSLSGMDMPGTTRVMQHAGGAAPGAEMLLPGAMGTWKALKPPAELKPGKSLWAMLQEIADKFRQRTGGGEGAYATLADIQSKYGLNKLGEGAFKYVYEVPTQGSTPLALAFQPFAPAGGQNRDILWPGHVKGIVPVWWYERGMPRSESRVFAMPKIIRDPNAQSGVFFGVSDVPSNSWYGPRQWLDVAEIQSKLKPRGLEARDLHSGNLLPEYSTELGRVRPVLVDRGGIGQASQSFPHKADHLLAEEQLQQILRNNPHEVATSWPTIARLIESGELDLTQPTPTFTSPHSSVSSSHWPHQWGQVSAPTPAPTSLQSSFINSQVPVPTPPVSTFSTGRSEDFVDKLISLARRGGSGVGAIPELGGHLRGAESAKGIPLNVVINLRNRVMGKLREMARENPSQAILIKEAFDKMHGSLPQHSFWQNMWGMKTPSPILIEGTGSDMKIRDLALEHMMERGMLPSWMKQAPRQFEADRLHGPQDFWDRLIEEIRSPTPSTEWNW